MILVIKVYNIGKDVNSIFVVDVGIEIALKVDLWDNEEVLVYSFRVD